MQLKGENKNNEYNLQRLASVVSPLSIISQFVAFVLAFFKLI